jgi:AbrB family looped-hinge helix DNA binding protein
LRITSKGQVTIPQNLRESLGLLPNTEVEFSVEGDILQIQKSGKARRGRKVVAHLKKFKKALSMSTQEIMALTRRDKD